VKILSIYLGNGEDLHPLMYKPHFVFWTAQKHMLETVQGSMHMPKLVLGQLLPSHIPLHEGGC